MLKNKQKGSALISALLLMSIVTLLAVGMITRQNLEIRRTESIFQNERLLSQAAWAELWAVERIRNISREVSTEFEYVDLDQTWAEPLNNFQQEGLTIDIAIIDLQGFFNINDIIVFSPAREKEDIAQGEGQTVGAESTLQGQETPLMEEEETAPTTPSEFLTEDNPYAPAWMLVRLLENTAGLSNVEARSLTESILYWMLPKVIGADTTEQDAYYVEQAEPYQVAHQVLTSVSELRLISGVTNPIYETLQPYITVISLGKKAEGKATKININTTTAQVLGAVLNIEPARAATLLSQRPYTQTEVLAEQLAKLKAQDDKGNEAEAMLDITSKYFLSRAVIHDNKRTLVQYSMIEREGEKVKVTRRIQGEM